MKKNQSIEKLIARACSHELSREEQKVLQEWIEASSENKKEFESWLALWKKSENLVVSGKIDVESSLRKIKKRIASGRTHKQWIIYLRQAAAVLLLAFTFSFLYTYFFPNRPEKSPVHSLYQEVTVAYGTQTQMLLADGTRVWLNSGSTLSFPDSFNEMKEREVVLNGEGYFEVTRDDGKPFIVNTSLLDVKVHGTSFNITAYDDYPSMSVALFEGKVSLMKEQQGEQKELMELKPHDVVEYNVKDNKLYHSQVTNMFKYNAWKNRYMVFMGDPIEQVARRLEKWFKVEMIIEDEGLRDYQFTATFIDESLEQILYLLSLSSPMEYKIIPAEKLEDNVFSMRKVILSKK